MKLLHEPSLLQRTEAVIVLTALDPMGAEATLLRSSTVAYRSAVMRATIVLFTFTLMAPLAHADAAGDIASFNRSLDDAIRRMSNAAVLALWDDDGVSLLPKTPPIVGKAAIGRFLDETTKQFPNGKVTTQKTDCFDVRVAGDWASEWCRAHQVADLGGGKRFDGWGKLLFVLHKGADGKWRIHEEMWNEDAPPK